MKKTIKKIEKVARGAFYSIPIGLGAITAPHIAEIEGALPAVGGALGAATIGAVVGIPVAFMWHEEMTEKAERLKAEKKSRKVM
jgi:hypothetical protein